ncbi:hypothetical protein ACN47E_006354 [Coniothyrium glycines]
MGAVHLAIDVSHVVHVLVNTLLDVLDATRDLYQTLTEKERRDYELSLQSKGYPSSRHIEYVGDETLGSDETIVEDKIAVKKQFEIGSQALGNEFAVGDVHAHVALQSQIITLQNVLVVTFLYGPTSSQSVAHQLVNIIAASKTARAAVVEILEALQRRQQCDSVPPVSRSLARFCSPARAPLNPVSARGTSTASSTLDTHNQTFRARGDIDGFNPHGTESVSTTLTPYHATRGVRSGSPVNTTTLQRKERPLTFTEKSDNDSTFITDPEAYSTQSIPHDLYCEYAMDLQEHYTQALASSVMSESNPQCPHCKASLHLSLGKAWEILRTDDSYDRCFQVSNRFVVKCHRAGPDGQYACVLCSEHNSSHTICGDVKALIKHIWEDHSIRELKREVDISEIIEQPEDRRRDSGIGHDASRGSRGSHSLASSKRQRSRPR